MKAAFWKKKLPKNGVLGDGPVINNPSKMVIMEQLYIKYLQSYRFSCVIGIYQFGHHSLIFQVKFPPLG